MKSRIYLEERVENTSRRFGSAKHYFPARVDINGETHVALFTSDEITDAVSRGDANPEDCPDPRPWWRRFLAAVWG